MKYIALSSVFIGVALSSSVEDTLIFAQGDTTCSGQLMELIRTNNVPDCDAIATSCFATSQAAGLSATTSSSISCASSVDGDFPASMSGKYSGIISYSNTGCSTADEVSAQYILADGNCHMMGPSYFSAQCTVGGSVTLQVCADSSCSQNCTNQYSADDNVCSGFTKYSCLDLSSGSVNSASNSTSSGSFSSSITASHILGFIGTMAAILSF